MSEPIDGYASDYAEFLALAPPWRALDKTKFFLAQARIYDVSNLVERRKAVFCLDAALVGLVAFKDVVQQYFQPPRPPWWESRLSELTGNRLWRELAANRNEGVHRIMMRAKTTARFARGGGADYSALHFALSEMERLLADNSDVEGQRLAMLFLQDDAIEIVAVQVEHQADFLREVEEWVRSRAAEPDEKV